jgi:YebC/PmpR family DNA-binding regulatory protein
MAGHSKWAQTKHKKAVVDARRGKLFAKLLRAIEVAARSGGGNTQANPTLADAVQRAKDASVPADNIDRAIKRGTGEVQGISYENLVYEGFAHGGVAVIVEVLTDNRNRAAAEVRKIFSKHGGNLGEPGSVAWMFQSRGIVLLPKSAIDEEGLLAVAMEAGAEDLRSEGDSWEIVCQAPQLAPLRRALEEAGLPIEVARLSMEPTTLVSLDAGAANPVLRLIDELEESDDVQEIYSNFDVPEEVLEEVAG